MVGIEKVQVQTGTCSQTLGALRALLNQMTLPPDSDLQVESSGYGSYKDFRVEARWSVGPCTIRGCERVAVHKDEGFYFCDRHIIDDLPEDE